MRLTRRLTLLVVILGALLRLYHWGGPLTSDEGYMLRSYANESAKFISTTYDAPNNHVLLSLILHAIDAAWPKKLILTLADPRPLQAPSLVAAAASLWLFMEVSMTLAGPVAALIGSVALAFSYWHLMYSNMLRGYSLSTALVMATIWLVLRAKGQRRVELFFVAALVAACAHYVIPSNVVFTIALGAGILIPEYLWAPLPQRTSKKRPIRQPIAPSTLLAAAGVCGLATLGAYLPILHQLMNHAGGEGLYTALLQSPIRLTAGIEPLGFGWAWAGPFAVISLAGAILALFAGKRSRATGVLALAFLLVPALIFTMQRVVAPARVYIPAIPIWCLAFGLAGRYLTASLSRRLASRSSRRLVAPLIACALSFAFLSQVEPYVRWNRGLDPRRALSELSSRTRPIDDFIVIVTDRGDDPRFGEINWDYYGFAAKLEPTLCLAVDKDQAYQARSKYIVLARDLSTASAALERSGVDEIMRRGLKLTGQHGRLSIYETSRDEAVLRQYVANGSSSGKSNELRLESFTGLGAQASAAGNFDEARQYFLKARALSPNDLKVRYQLGLAEYLSFDDRSSIADLQWVVDNDPANAQAPLFLADAYAQSKNNERALKWFRWYQEAGHAPENWVFKNMAAQGIEAVQSGRGSPRLSGATAEGWLQFGIENNAKGALFRAAEAYNRSLKMRATPAGIVRLAIVLGMVHQYVAAETIFRGALSRGAPQQLRLSLARVLRDKGDYENAREELGKVISANPSDPEAGKLEAELARL